MLGNYTEAAAAANRVIAGSGKTITPEFKNNLNLSLNLVVTPYCVVKANPCIPEIRGSRSLVTNSGYLYNCVSQKRFGGSEKQISWQFRRDATPRITQNTPTNGMD